MYIVYINGRKRFVADKPVQLAEVFDSIASIKDENWGLYGETLPSGAPIFEGGELVIKIVKVEEPELRRFEGYGPTRR